MLSSQFLPVSIRLQLQRAFNGPGVNRFRHVASKPLANLPQPLDIGKEMAIALQTKAVQLVIFRFIPIMAPFLFRGSPLARE